MQMMKDFVDIIERLIDESRYSTNFKACTLCAYMGHIHLYHFDEPIKRTKLQTLFTLSAAVIKDHTIPKNNLPSVLQHRLVNTKAVWIYNRHMYHYTAFGFDLHCEQRYHNPFACRVGMMDHVKREIFPAVIPNTTEYVSTMVPVSLPPSVKYLSLNYLGLPFHITIPLLYLRLERICDSVTTTQPITILVTCNTLPQFYESLLPHVKYFINYICTPPRASISTDSLINMYAFTASPPVINITSSDDAVILQFSETSQFLLNQLKKKGDQRDSLK